MHVSVMVCNAHCYLTTQTVCGITESWLLDKGKQTERFMNAYHDTKTSALKTKTGKWSIKQIRIAHNNS